MKSGRHFISISCLLMVVFCYQNVDAQQNLAQEAYAIFEQSCLICHGENGSYTEALIIEHTALIDDGKVIPGNPDGSVFYQRLIETDVAKRMPLGQPALNDAAIETIRQWIAAGAPDWDAVPRPDTDFITTDAMLETIENHVNSLSSNDRSFARYFTLTHLYNAGESDEALNAYRRALSKLINSLSWGREVVKPMPIDAAETLFYIDLRDYEWDVRNDAWTQIEQAYPYQMTFDAPTQTLLRDKLTTLQQEMSCDVPFVHVDWFLAAASLPPLYHDILALPQTDRELEEELRVFVTANLQNAPGERVWRAGFNESGVSRHNRVVERHTSSYGAYWKSYDFAGSAESQNIFTHPLDFIHDGGEIIFNLPNGLQAYFLVDANGGRLDVAPTDIVSNPAVSDPAVRNGLSCIGCHTQGMKSFEDEVRAVVDQADNPPFDKARALNLYVEKTVMDAFVEEDTLRYRNALEAAGGVFGGIEPIQRFYEVFHGSLGAAHAAASVGLETDVFLEKISKNVSLQNLLGVLVLEDGTVKRDAWTSNFDTVIDALNTPESVLPPVVERPERIPGAGVYIPDVNLRAAIAEELGKAASDVITVEEMKMLIHLNSVDASIQDLTGLQLATNLESFVVQWSFDGMLSDLSHLVGLTKLKRVSVSGKSIIDLSPLSGLINIEDLVLFSTSVSDLSPLMDLTKMKRLYFNHAPVSDLSPLAGLTNMEKLEIFYAESPSLEPFKGLVELKKLSVGRSRISDISPLSGLINLEELELFDNHLISDVSPLASLRKLRRLNLHRNKVSDVSSLASLHELEWIDIAYNDILDISLLEGLPNKPIIIWHDNPSFPIGGPKIEGPWEWTMVPGPELDSSTDFLSQASGGGVTELQIATYGAVEGESVGESTWTAHKITPSGENNISEMTNTLGWTSGEETVGYILYGSIKLNSPREQHTQLFVGADDGVKVWFNGEFIHKNFGGRWDPSAISYQSVIPVTLNVGVNVLLVAIDNRWGDWSGFFGFGMDTEYTELPSGISIPDINFRAAIAKALGKGGSAVVSITTEDMAKLKSLKVIDKGIQDLTGLQFATNLQSLEVWGNQISDLSPLQELTKLDRLNLKYNAVSDLSPISDLINLTEINLESNFVSDLSPLINMKKLGSLKLWDCPVSDLSPLAELTELTELNLADQRWYDLGVIDLSPLTGLTNMESLTIHNLKLSSGLAPLTGLINLKYLKFDSNNVSDVSPLANLINLENITTWGNRISDFSPLANLTKLKTINICGANIMDFLFLDGKTELTELYLRSNGISDVSHLAGLTGLERLNLEDNNISDVSAFAALTNLEWLKLTDNPITDFSPLAELFENTNIVFDVPIPDVNLRAAIAETLGIENTDTVPITFTELVTLTTLKASNRDIKDLTGLEHAINLEEMWISGNPISDLSPLAGLTNFIGLHAWETSISDLSPLTGMTKLRWLDFGNTAVSDLSPLSDMTSLRKLTFYACDIKDISPLSGLTGLTRLAVGGNREISDASAVAELINLEHLDFHHDSISDLKPLAGLTKLKYLNLYDNRLISDVSPLAGLTSLTNLNLGKNMISDVSHLSQLINLTSLELPRNMLIDVSPLAGLINLETLNLRENSIDDFSTLQRLSENTYIVMLNNPGAPVEGPTIEGPWLWMLVPGESLDNTTDLLAEASGGIVTEQQVATKGATEGNAVGDNKWTAHKISSTTNFHKIRNNMREVLHAFDLSENDETSDNVLYGCVILGSPKEQETRMLVGGEGHHRIWLNGEQVYDNLSFRKYFDYLNYSAFFSVTLKQGANILLVAVDRGHWITGHFGFEEGVEYTVIPPDMVSRPSFSASETNVLTGDTFTLDLNAENITDLAGWEADIAFDPNVLEAVEVTQGDFLKSDGGDTFFGGGTIDNVAGKITGLFSARQSGGGTSGTGALLTVTFRAKTSGESDITLENFEFGSITGDIIPAVPPSITITVGDYPAWDVNQDGRVSILDLILVAQDFGSGAPANLRTDVNRDGVVNIQDLIIVAQHFGETTDSAAPPIIAIDSKELTPTMVQAWIQQAEIEDDGSVAFRQGIENLQRLLASLTPEKTALLANYPNPFNPETWIPYHLAKPADVTLTIYAANGTVVRTLALGHQSIGMYQGKSRAAHWDGKNAIGEPVASGMYFYTLKAGDFIATRKMLIRK